ncbi:MAG: hypothetical protein ACR2IQ_02725 [Minisyncoccia bacterium]
MTTEELIENNLETLETYFMKNDDIGMMCNKDNIEDYFSSWLENQDDKTLKEIIDNEQFYCKFCGTHYQQECKCNY